MAAYCDQSAEPGLSPVDPGAFPADKAAIRGCCDGGLLLVFSLTLSAGVIDVATPDAKRPTYAAEAIPADVTNGVFLGNPVLDNVVSCMIAMSAELWSTKRRMKVLEAVLAKSGVPADKLEKYVPTAQETLEWEQERDRFIDLVMSPLANQGYRSFSSDFDKR
jgi:hypothetical protein